MMSGGKEVGLHRSWHENGRRHSIGVYRAGLAEGRHRSWNSDGELTFDGRYREDERDGVWNEASEDGFQSSRGRYARGKEEGLWTFNYEGKRQAVGSFRRGLREGVWTFYDYDGKRVRERGRYHRGVREGTWTFHGLRHQMADEVIAGCRRGAPHGRVVWWRTEPAPDVKPGYTVVATFARGSLHGRWTERYPAGTRNVLIHRGVYRDGLLVRGEDLDANPLGIDVHQGDARRLCEDDYDDDLPGRGD
jgi:hypothetical protein